MHAHGRDFVSDFNLSFLLRHECAQKDVRKLSSPLTSYRKRLKKRLDEGKTHH